MLHLVFYEFESGSVLEKWLSRVEQKHLHNLFVFWLKAPMHCHSSWLMICPVCHRCRAAAPPGSVCWCETLWAAPLCTWPPNTATRRSWVLFWSTVSERHAHSRVWVHRVTCLLVTCSAGIEGNFLCVSYNPMSNQKQLRVNNCF